VKSKICLKSYRYRIDLDRYSGKWVAFIDNHVVACAKELDALMQKTKRQRLTKEPSVMLIPRKDEGPYIPAL